MSRILAIDYGSRRVGLAVTDPQQLIATPLDTISPHSLIDYIKNYLLGESLEQIVVGYPLKEDGSPTDFTAMVDRLLLQLRKEFQGMPITTHDERYTSKLAQRSLIESGARKKARRKKSNLDQISATLILQSFLEEKSLSS